MTNVYRNYKGGQTRTFQKLYGYRNLLVWQAADDLATQVHHVTRSFGASYRDLAHQMLKSAVSAKSNIAEGYCRNALGDYIRFCEIGRGSLGELGSQIQDAERWELIAGGDLDETLALFKDASYLLEKLIRSLYQQRKDGGWNRDLNIREERNAYSGDGLELPDGWEL